jgi:hypothetical protein
MRALAQDYRLPDIRASDDGLSVMQNLRKNPSFSPSWGNVAHAAPGFSQRNDAKTFDPGSMGVQSDNVIERMKPQFTGPRPSYVNKAGAK